MQRISEERMTLIDQLEERAWWRATDPQIQLAIAMLPESWKGFILDLIARKDTVGGLEQKKLVRFVTDVGMFGALLTFETINHNDHDKVQTYMYFSWRAGPASGSKGLAFVANDLGQITHFIHMRAEKFACGGVLVDDLPGGFGEPGEKVLTTFIRELKEEVSPDIAVKYVVPLGEVMPDPGMTNNSPSIFYAVVSMTIPEGESESAHEDKPEVTSKYTVRPVSEFREFIAASNDCFTLAIYARMILNGTTFA